MSFVSSTSAAYSSSIVSQGTTTPWGWDYGLKTPVIATPWPNEANYFSTDGTIDTSTPHWTLAVESENDYGASFPGPADQSFPVTKLIGGSDGSKGPISLGVTSSSQVAGAGSLTVEMKTDLYNNSQPGGAGYFTWCAFGLNANLGGGSLPPPNLAQFDVNLEYTAWLPNAGAHVAVEYQGWWNNQSFEFSIDLNRQGGNWGTNSGSLVQNVDHLNGLTFVLLNGAALNLTLIPGVNMSVHINWGQIIQGLVDQGVVPAPTGGWANSTGQDVYVSTEMANQAESRSGVVDVHVNNFRVSTGPADTPSMLTQIGGDTMFSLAVDSGQEIDSLTGATVQRVPSVPSDTIQFISIDGRTYGTNYVSARSLGLDPTRLNDYDGNNLGAQGQWVDLGIASVQPGAAPSYILVDPQTGRWSEVAVQSDGSINYGNHGQNGDTRVVGTYIDPLISLGLVTPGGPTDSQAAFLKDVKSDNLSLLGSVYDQENGGMDLIFSLNNAPGFFLRAILHTDGNIRYANYVSAAQLMSWGTKAEIPSALLHGWLAKG